MTPLSAPRALAGVALVLGVLAAFAGGPGREHPGDSTASTPATAAAQRDADAVTAIDLAQWIRARRPGLQVIDLRAADQFGDYHVPSARNAPGAALDSLRIAVEDTIVLYSESSDQAARAAKLLRGRGYPDAHFLHGGLAAWIEQVMNPILADDASPVAKAEFQRLAELSRYFGGVPRAGVAAGRPPAPATSVPDAVVRLRGRGC